MIQVLLLAPVDGRRTRAAGRGLPLLLHQLLLSALLQLDVAGVAAEEAVEVFGPDLGQQLVDVLLFAEMRLVAFSPLLNVLKIFKNLIEI
jgi:hypothetical protein